MGRLEIVDGAMYGVLDAEDVSPGMYRHCHASTTEGAKPK